VIVEYVRYAIANDRREGFEAAYAEASAALDASRHCIGYELARCVEDPARYILRIEWDSAEGHMKGFSTRPEFRTFFASIRPTSATSRRCATTS
jgi:quinol monooxygenase YgiN